jgi:hypothetical protein
VDKMAPKVVCAFEHRPDLGRDHGVFPAIHSIC